MPLSQLALICTLKGGKYNIEAEQMSGVASCNLNSSLKLFTNMSVSETVDLIFKDPVLLHLAASASLVVQCAELMVHVSEGTDGAGIGRHVNLRALPLSPRACWLYLPRQK